MAQSSSDPYTAPEYLTKNRIATFSMEVLHDSGRILLLDMLECIVHTRMAALVARIRQNDPTWKLKDLLKEVGHIFYIYDIGNYTYIALSRNYFYINTRFAKSIEGFSDHTKEMIIYFKGRPTENSKILEYAKKFREYDLAKCAVSILELLNTLHRAVPKGKTKFSIRRVMEKYYIISPLAKALLRFCGEPEDLSNMEIFIRIFKSVFRMERTFVAVDVTLLDGLIKSFEIDLIWSYTGICIVKGVTFVPALAEEVNEMITRAKLRFTSQVEAKEIGDMLAKRDEQYFVPGDGIVYIMFPYILEERAELIRGFFMEYLLTQKKTFYYSRCYEILIRSDPGLLQSCGDYSFVALASILYAVPEEFSFVNGYVMLSAQMVPPRIIRDLAPVEVPITMFYQSFKNCDNDLQEGKGFVQEVGIRSAVIRFHQDTRRILKVDRTPSHVTIEVHAYCHKISCIYDNQEIDDFTHFLRVGDYIKFLYLPQETAHVNYPVYCTITDVLGFLDPDEEFSDDQEPQICETRPKLQRTDIQKSLESGLEGTSFQNVYVPCVDEEASPHIVHIASPKKTDAKKGSQKTVGASKATPQIKISSKTPEVSHEKSFHETHGVRQVISIDIDQKLSSPKTVYARKVSSSEEIADVSQVDSSLESINTSQEIFLEETADDCHKTSPQETTHIDQDISPQRSIEISDNPPPRDSSDDDKPESPKQIVVIHDTEPQEIEVIQDTESQETEVIQDTESQETEVIKDTKPQETEVIQDTESQEPEVIKDPKPQETDVTKDVEPEETDIAYNAPSQDRVDVRSDSFNGVSSQGASPKKSAVTSRDTSPQKAASTPESSPQKTTRSRRKYKKRASPKKSSKR